MSALVGNGKRKVRLLAAVPDIGSRTNASPPPPPRPQGPADERAAKKLAQEGEVGVMDEIAHPGVTVKEEATTAVPDGQDDDDKDNDQNDLVNAPLYTTLTSLGKGFASASSATIQSESRAASRTP